MTGYLAERIRFAVMCSCIINGASLDPADDSMATADLKLDSTPNKVAAVCYRSIRGSVEFLLVRTKSGRWTFPKGNIEPHLSLRESAELEAYEEAGALGRIGRVHFDHYRHMKSSCRETGFDGLLVAAFLLQVEETIPPQETHREPTWFGPREAKAQLAEGRSLRFSREFSRVIDSALTKLYVEKRRSRRRLLRPDRFGVNHPKLAGSR